MDGLATAPVAQSTAQPDSPAAAQGTISQGSEGTGNSATGAANTAPAGAPSTAGAEGTPDAGNAPHPPTDGQQTTPPAPPTADISIAMPDGVAVNAPMLQSYTDFAKKSGMSQQQAQGAAEWFMQENAAQQAAYKQSGEDYLRGAWGNDFTANMETSRKAIAQFDKMFGGRFSTQLVNTGLADAPVMAELFHFLGGAISEEGMATGSPSATHHVPQSLLEHVQSTINKS